MPRLMYLSVQPCGSKVLLHEELHFTDLLHVFCLNPEVDENVRPLLQKQGTRCPATRSLLGRAASVFSFSLANLFFTLTILKRFFRVGQGCMRRFTLGKFEKRLRAVLELVEGQGQRKWVCCVDSGTQEVTNVSLGEGTMLTPRL